MIKERQKSILSAVIEEYIRTARPVASRELVREFDFDVSPATIRSELLNLDELGYLVQPHTSAGRIPTDRGYRFFVDNMLTDEDLDHDERQSIQQTFAIGEEREFVRALSRAVSQVSGMFTAAGMSDRRIFYETGFSEIVEEPEFGDPARMRSFATLADGMDEYVHGMLESLDANQDSMIFIGKENPWKAAREYAMTLSFWEHPRGFRGFVSMVGPTRTNYQKQKAILTAIAHIYE